MTPLRRPRLFVLFALAVGCASQPEKKVPVSHEFFLAALSAPELSTLTELRRSQGRPDPMEISVLARESVGATIPQVHIRLQRRDGEPEAFQLCEFDAAMQRNYRVTLLDDAGVEWTGSIVDRQGRTVEWFAGSIGLYFERGFVWANTLPPVQGAVPPPLMPSAQPDDWFQLSGHEFPESPPPGPYMLTVQFQVGSSSIVTSSEPTPVTITGS